VSVVPHTAAIYRASGLDSRRLRRPARGSSICALRESLRRHNGYSCDQ